MTVEPTATRLRHQVPLIAWLVVVWMLLWGTWSWANLLSGLLIAFTVLAVLPLPHVVGGARVRPAPLLAFLGHFVVDLFVSGAQVAWQAMRPRWESRSAIVQVRLRADSDLLLTLVVGALSLIPGSLVLDLDREEKLITLHLLQVRDLAAVAEEKERVLRTEDRLVRAFGSPADVALLGRAGLDGARP